MKKWWPLIVLAAAQFLMTLDMAVMNVSISQLVEDFDTDVTSIQGVITLYSLVMAALMITGGKLGDIFGRRRVFGIGLVIYGIGSAITAVSGTVGMLMFGWSVLEGIGAALVLPALAALIAGTYAGKDRITAYAVIGGVAGAGIAVGPILGGWLTTAWTWRVVFVGEVILAILILLFLNRVRDAERPDPKPQLDWVGSILSAFGLGLVVFAILQASTWGWISPVESPIEPFGLSLTPFMIGAGVAILWLFRAWSQRREDAGLDPLVRFKLFEITPLRSGLLTFLTQNLTLMGIFFVLPLYLQLVQGLDALETGIRLLPVSIAMLVTSLSGSKLASWFSARAIVRVGFALILLATLLLIATIEPTLEGTDFAVAMVVLGIGMGLIVSQLGNVVLSSVGPEARSEAGGLQYTSQQFGSALGVALIGAIVISSLGGNFGERIASNESIEPQIQQEIAVSLTGAVSFVTSADVTAAVEAAGIDEETSAAIVEDYENAQLVSLKFGLLVVGGIVLISFFVSRGLPARRADELVPAAVAIEK
jgi:EmrB/QacA subfamily drug resistance transporter